VNLHGDERALALSGGPVADGLTVALGDAPVPAGAAPVVRYADVAAAAGEHLISVGGGDGSWRTGPRPAADALFALAPAPFSSVLVVGEGQDELLERLGERGLSARAEPALSVEALARCGAVYLSGSPFPDEGFCALAARRLVVLESPATTFGLQDGIDCLFAAVPGEAAAALDAAARRPEGFAAMAAMGRLAAEAHRASAVYARLAVDLLGEAMNARSASST
jgi:hypothetical protein